MEKLPPVCDYEGSDYRTRFWEGQGREYEDLTERVAIKRLMPPIGSSLIDIGAAFGRLASEFKGYEKVVLLDYSSSMLREGRERLGDDNGRFVYVAANWYEMPFVDGLFETLVQVRTMHHAAEAPKLLGELARISRPDGHYILEFANKQNLKAMLRYALNKQEWSPYEREPIEFVELNFDFHPKWMREQLTRAGFTPGKTLTSSYLRLGFLKRNVPVDLLVKIDSVLQKTGGIAQMSPSVWYRSKTPADGAIASADQFFACPKCKAPLTQEGDLLPCSCGKTWAIKDGVYDFKDPV